MKKTVLTFGLISGCVASLMMILTMPFIDRIGFDKGWIVGYTGIVLSFLMVFFGIRSYRENAGNGEISFGRAFLVGILITLISCVFYVVTWEIIYFAFLPDFFDKYIAYAAQQMKASGATPEMINQKVLAMKAINYNNPLVNAALTFTEPFPIGLLVTLISSLVLRKVKRAKNNEVAVAG